jgi:hypothetical protein
MGNNFSKKKDDINIIAAKYILSMNNKSLKQLQNQSYCKKLNTLLEKIKKKTVKEGYSWKHDTEFYIKIAHIYAVIKLVEGHAPLAPHFTQTLAQPLAPLLYEKGDGKGDSKESHKESHKESLTESLKGDSKGGQGGSACAYITPLYYDDNYNCKTGQFESMSEDNKAQFEKDLKHFYLHYTGNVAMPQHIKCFNDIKLIEYDKLKLGKNPTLLENNLFSKYSTSLKETITFVNEKQQELINIINKLFVIVDNIIQINPKINEKIVDELIIETRNIIVELYLKSEDLQIENMKIYEAIINSIILKTVQSQINNLYKQKLLDLMPQKSNKCKSNKGKSNKSYFH